MHKTLILGSSGNLGTQLKTVFPEAIAWDSKDIDVTDFANLQTKILGCHNLSMIINCVAYNDVDGAETSPESAFLLNCEVPKKIAELAKEINSTFIHFSTGYVFSGYDKIEHTEADQPDPLSIYGKSKAEGEKEILKINGDSYLIRTNLLFGPTGTSKTAKPNVIDTMYRIGKERKILKGITDEYCNFTYTPDLAMATKTLFTSIKKQGMQPGIYHLTNEGYGTWYDLAKKIFELKEYDIREDGDPTKLPENGIIIQSITAADYPRPAKRPKSAVILNTKLPKLRSWEDALKDYSTKI